MDCTLDAIDLVTTDPDGGGATAVLTDHRTRDELDLAIVLALTEPAPQPRRSWRKLFRR